MKSIFDINETQLGRQLSDSEMNKSASMDLSDLLTKLLTWPPHTVGN